MTTRIIVCGGRDFVDRALLFAALDAITPRTEADEHGNDMPRDVTIVHGKCPRGADAFADEWAVVNWCDVQEFPADWDKHGRAAGPIRNRQMAMAGADFLVAFRGGRGTNDMIAQAHARRIPIRRPTWGNLLGT